MKYFILVGEKSGDLHGSNLIQELKSIDPSAEIQAWGGDEMQRAGAKILVHHKKLAIMGLLGVLQNLSRLKNLFKLFGEQIEAFQPDTVIFIDYGGFNLKAARIAKTKGFHTQFYIAPKVWAWNKGRVETIKKWIDELYVIFPFEKNLFESHGIPTHYVGNPLQDAISSFRPDPTARLSTGKYVALLPGSRKQEILSSMPIFEALSLEMPELDFFVAGVSEWKEEYTNYSIPVIFDKTYQVLQGAQAAIVTSGTATLETALLEIPQIVVYKTDWLFYSLAKLLVKIKYISLVNIILDRAAVPELIQHHFSTAHLKKELKEIIPADSPRRIKQLSAYEELKTCIGNAGASKTTAQKIIASTQKFKQGNS
jgi:lipid-A-disaccharide synthase